MAADHRTQMLKGVLTLVLLRLLDEEESYGYGIVQRLHAAGLDYVREGTVYPALARLERDGHVSTRLVPSHSGPARKYYEPSASGRALLVELEDAWGRLVAAVDRMQTGEPVGAPLKET